MDKKILPHINDFILDLANNNYSLLTLQNYKRDLMIFASFLSKNQISFDNISKNDISMYKGYLKSGLKYDLLNQENAGVKPQIQKSSSNASKIDGNKISRLSARSINRMLSSLRRYLRFLIDFDYKIPIAPDAIKLVKVERKESRVAEFEDLVKLVEFPTKFERNNFTKSRNRAILELLFSTGMRISELVSLNLADIDLTADHFSIRDRKIYVMGKGKKQRFVYLTDRAKKFIEEYLKLRNDDLPALFIPKRGRRLKNAETPADIRISARYIQNRIKLYRRLLGIVVPTSAHSLRHGFATYLAEQGASPAAIQRLLGHESLQTTTKYVHASDKFAEETHKKFHPLKE